MYRKSITRTAYECKVAKCAVLRAAKQRLRLEQAARTTYVEVLRVTFQGAALGSRTHIVTVQAGALDEPCDLYLDGRLLRSRSWSRCRSVLLRRIFKAVSPCPRATLSPCPPCPELVEG